MLRQTMVAFTGITAGLSATLIAAPAAHAEPAVATGAMASDVGIMAGCGGWSARDSRVFGDLSLHIPSTSTNSGNYDCTLREGASGIPVKKLQDALRRCHNKNLGTEDDNQYYGPNTREAVRSIQGEFGITRDGIYGPVTKTKLGWPRYGDPASGGGAPKRCERATNVPGHDDYWNAS